MPSKLGNKGEGGSFGWFRAFGRLDSQRLKGVEARKSRSRQKSKNVPVGSNSSKRGVTIHGMFTPSGRPSPSCTQFGSPASESDR
jgi:hypothetical protein